MKKSGILNAALMGELTKLRHHDKMVICDAGFPVPRDAVVVDVSLVAGVPDFMQTLKAVLNEMIFEKYAVFSTMKEKNHEYYDDLKAMLKNQDCSEVTPEKFVEMSNEAKLFVRTGELKPASNILLVSASGVPDSSLKYDVAF